MTKKCENCIHYECCCDWVSSEDLKDLGTGENCETYKDKSLCVELPCRCKDCKYLRKSFVGLYYCDNEKNGAAKKYTELNEYCSYAERKESKE